MWRVDKVGHVPRSEIRREGIFVDDVHLVFEVAGSAGDGGEGRDLKSLPSISYPPFLSPLLLAWCEYVNRSIDQSFR